MRGRCSVPLTAAADNAAVGGKGASLGSLARAGVAVPPGFVVTSSAFAASMDALDPAVRCARRSRRSARADLAAIARVTAAVRERVAAAPLPAPVASAITDAGTPRWAMIDPDVAVRSSATMEDSAAASFAGLQDTYLGVARRRFCGPTTCGGAGPACTTTSRWPTGAACACPRTGHAMAVVVQRMVSPRAAGVMFTRSPVTGDRSVVAIEGTWGLGSALVSGDVTPDSFMISKITGEITGRRVSREGPSAFFYPERTRRDRHRHPCCAARGGLPHRRRDPGARGRRPPGRSPLRRPPGHRMGPPGRGRPGRRAHRLAAEPPETVWAARTAAPVAAPKRRPADHVLSLFGKPQ